MYIQFIVIWVATCYSPKLLHQGSKDYRGKFATHLYTIAGTDKFKTSDEMSAREGELMQYLGTIHDWNKTKNLEKEKIVPGVSNDFCVMHQVDTYGVKKDGEQEMIYINEDGKWRHD